MSTIQDIFQQAQLAEAAYAKFAAFPNNDVGVFNALKANDFSDQQATEFLTNWRVVDQIPKLLGDGAQLIFHAT